MCVCACVVSVCGGSRGGGLRRWRRKERGCIYRPRGGGRIIKRVFFLSYMFLICFFSATLVLITYLYKDRLYKDVII